MAVVGAQLRAGVGEGGAGADAGQHVLQGPARTVVVEDFDGGCDVQLVAGSALAQAAFGALFGGVEMAGGQGVEAVGEGFAH